MVATDGRVCASVTPPLSGGLPTVLSAAAQADAEEDQAGSVPFRFRLWIEPATTVQERRALGAVGALQQGAGGLGSAHRSWSTTATQLQTGTSPKLACGYPSPVPAILLNLQHSCGKSREADNSLKQLLFAPQQGDLKLEPNWLLGILAQFKPDN